MICQQFNSCCEHLALPLAYLVSDIKVCILNVKRSNYFSLESNIDVEDETHDLSHVLRPWTE